MGGRRRQQRDSGFLIPVITVEEFLHVSQKFASLNSVESARITAWPILNRWIGC
jgi:hypothetical protein